MFTCRKKQNKSDLPTHEKSSMFPETIHFFCGPIFKIQVRTVYQNISTFNSINITINGDAQY